MTWSAELAAVVLAAFIVSAVLFAWRKNKAKDRAGDEKKNIPGKAGRGKSGKGGAPRSKLRKTVSDSIPFSQFWEDGTFQTDIPNSSESIFSRMYRLPEVDFMMSSNETQEDIFSRHGKLLDSFSHRVRFQFLIVTRSANQKILFDSVRFEPQRDGLNRFRTELDEYALNAMAQGHNLTQDKFLVISCRSRDLVYAMGELDNAEKAAKKAVDSLSHAPFEREPYSSRLEVLFSIYRYGSDDVFENSFDVDRNPYFDLSKVYMSGHTAKEHIAPDSFHFLRDHFEVGDLYGRSMLLNALPSEMDTDFIADLSSVETPMVLSMNFEPVEMGRAMKMIREQMVRIDGDISEKEQNARKGGYTSIPLRLEMAQQNTRQLMEDVVEYNQKIYFITLTITLFSTTMEELNKKTEEVKGIGKAALCNIRAMNGLQEIGFDSSLPFSNNSVPLDIMCTTNSASVFIPYTSQELHQKNGVLFGVNAVTRNAVFCNRRNNENFNGLIIGKSGSGKSTLTKTNLECEFFRWPDAQFYIIDPKDEYREIVQTLHGQVIDLQPGSSTYINPLDMDIRYHGAGQDPIAMKSDYLSQILEVIVGSGRELPPNAKGVMGRCTKNIYRGYLNEIDRRRQDGEEITCDPATAPILNDLKADLERQPEPIAHELAECMEAYTTGAWSMFSHRTNIELNSRIVSYNTRQLGTGMKSLGLLVCLNDVLNRMVENYSKGIWTYLYIDELHMILESETAAKMLATIYKIVRQYLGVPTGILQNTENLLKSQAARDILNNSDMVVMMNLKKIDRENIKNLYNLSDTQIEHITDTDPGYGLLYSGKKIVPFVFVLEPGTELYRLNTTSRAKDEASSTLGEFRV